MNWYKLSQLYIDIDRKEYDDNHMFNAERYFSIGQSEETQKQSFCQVWLNNNLYIKEGQTTHSALLSTLVGVRETWKLTDKIYRGWYDPVQELLSVVVPRKTVQGIDITGSDQIPEELDEKLRSHFGYKFKYVVFT